MGHRKSIAVALLTCCLIFAIYSNTFKSPFIFDDHPNIVENNGIHLTSFDSGSIKRVLMESHLPQRPISNISFALNYYFHQEKVQWYRIVNIVIHLANGALLYVFIKLTLGLPVLRSQLQASARVWIAFATALVWLVHPIQTQSVTYVVQRMNSLAALFYLIAFICYIKGRLVESNKAKWVLFAGGAASFFLALGAKEMVAVLPFLIVLYEVYFFQDLQWKKIRRFSLVFAGLIIFAIIICFSYLGTESIERIQAGYAIRDFNAFQRVMTEFRVVVAYASLLFFPHPSRLNFDHHFTVSNSLADPPTTLFSLIILLSVIGCAVIGAKKYRLISFCILWYFINLVIESSVIGLELAFEHRLYIPSMAVVLLIVLMVDKMFRSKQLKVGVLCGVVLLFSSWTFERNKVWQSRLTLWEDSAKKSPAKTRTLNSLGLAYYSQGRYGEALKWHQKAISINPLVPASHYYLANALKMKFRLEEAAYHYAKAVQLYPAFDKARHELTVIQRLIQSQKLEKNKE